MNQAIQFPDRENWDEAAQCVCFPVLVSGFIYQCRVSKDRLIAEYGENDPLSLFNAHRFDFEDEVEDKVKKQQIDDKGFIHLG